MKCAAVVVSECCGSYPATWNRHCTGQTVVHFTCTMLMFMVKGNVRPHDHRCLLSGLQQRLTTGKQLCHPASGKLNMANSLGSESVKLGDKVTRSGGKTELCGLVTHNFAAVMNHRLISKLSGVACKAGGRTRSNRVRVIGLFLSKNRQLQWTFAETLPTNDCADSAHAVQASVQTWSCVC